MFVAWLKIGVNISNMPFSLASIGFHAGLASIFGLYYCFWLQLDMFTTIKYLIMISVVTFLCGNSLLVKLAEKRNQPN
jgi:oligosaccharyltransferase complex subunit delta (ribophorin II)